jgi:hypothetical protein
MRRVHHCVSAVLLVASATAWAGYEPYPEAVIGESVSTKTRAEVVAELREAIRTGQMDDSPSLYAERQALAESNRLAAAGEASAGASSVAFDGDAVVVWGDARLVRAKIQAEAAEANRLGLLSFGEGDPPIATAEQEELIAAAGRRAVSNFWIVGSL